MPPELIKLFTQLTKTVIDRKGTFCKKLFNAFKDINVLLTSKSFNYILKVTSSRNFFT